MQSSFVPIGLSSVTDDYFRGKFKIIQHEIVSTNSDSNLLQSAQILSNRISRDGI